jgi:pyrrolidone-carboxylate peptidase
LKILIYAFSNQWGTNISRRVLLELQKLLEKENVPCQGKGGAEHQRVYSIINFHPRDFYKKYIEHNSYSLIIGLGDAYGYTGKIKIETQAKNAYNEKPIYPFAPILIDLNIPIIDNLNSDYFKISSSMGTYNCNWIAFSTQLYLNQNNLNTHHLFLHLPPKSNASVLTQRIVDLLGDNQTISTS